MFAKKLSASVLAVLLVVAAVGPAVTAVSSRGQAYAGTHVSFDTTNDAIVDYAVDGETMLESVRVQSQEKARSQGSAEAGANLSSVIDLSGAVLSIGTESETSATVAAESSAELRAHDNERGILVVSSGEESQYVGVTLSSSTEAERESNERVVVTTADGTEGTFIVVGDGQVVVNDEGNVSAELAEDSQLVFRAYDDERDDEDKRQERLIANGTAAAEVYVQKSGESGGEAATDVVHYGENTTVEVTERSEGEIRMTAERTEHEGRVIITSMSEAVIESTDDLSVMVDGEAAVEASSYSELESATEGGDTSKFLVRQHSRANAAGEVLIGVNHFSERDIVVQSGSDARAKSYAGVHTSFNASGDAVTDYAVNGETMLESVRIQSQSEAQDSDAEGGLSAVANVSLLSISAESETSATVAAESGAALRAHDSPEGTMVISSGEEAQYVGITLASSTEAERASNDRVVVTSEDGTDGAFIVVGDGEVAATDGENVTAELDGDSRLVFRAYSDGRDEADEHQEKLIANGTAAAEVYVRESGERSGEFVAGVANYSQDTTVEVTGSGEGYVEMTAERTEHEGRVIITSVSRSVIESTDGMQVTVDGEAAAEASSYAELESATEGGDTSKYLVRQQGSGQANADVLIGVNHFSERSLAVSGDGESGTSTPGQPGLGIGIALIALLGAALLAVRMQ